MSSNRNDIEIVRADVRGGHCLSDKSATPRDSSSPGRISECDDVVKVARGSVWLLV
jgi:hypothetical protein